MLHDHNNRDEEEAQPPPAGASTGGTITPLCGESQFMPLPGDRYTTCLHPETEIEQRCQVLALSSGGRSMTVRFYDRDKQLPAGEPVSVDASTVRPLLYPPAGVPRVDLGPPLPKSQLLSTDSNSGLSSAEAKKRAAMFGPNALEVTSRNKLLDFLNKFRGPMPIMIWMALGVEVWQGMWTSFLVLLVLQLVNGTLSWYEDMKAGDAVASLRASLAPQATCMRDGSWSNVDASSLVPGDVVLLALGSSVPADCELLAGPMKIDQAALTGESLPVTMVRGQIAKMGSTVTSGECEALVYDHGPYTFFGKTACMIAAVDEPGNFQKVLMRVLSFIMGMSFLLIGLVCALLISRGEDILDAVAFGVVLLVASIPIAMEVVSTSTMALGSKALAREGAVVSRLSAIEEIAGMGMLCSDKTGTLTQGIMQLQSDSPTFVPGMGQKELLRYAAMACKWDEPPKDALDTLVLQSFDRPSGEILASNSDEASHLATELAPYTLLAHTPFDPSIRRTESTILGPNGQHFRVTKVAPHVILDMIHDKDSLRPKVEGIIDGFAKRGVRCMSIARTKPADDDQEESWEYLPFCGSVGICLLLVSLCLCLPIDGS
jgi:H+-transporting ATPase